MIRDFKEKERRIWEMNAKTSGTFGNEIIEETRYDNGYPPGYEVVEVGDWINYIKPNGEIPVQGWKIHLSCDVRKGGELLNLLKPRFFEWSLDFKHIRSVVEHEYRNSRRIGRSYYGKFITVFPDSLEHAQEVVTRLSPLVDEFKGPVITTDLQIGSSIVFIRYGLLKSQQRFDEVLGRQRDYLIDPDGGTHWVDRKSTFELPEWAPRSEWIDSLIELHESKDVHLPFRNPTFLKKTSRGLVFTADFEGQRVFVKEARRRSELDALGRDTVSRFYNERHLLEKLVHLPYVPTNRCLVEAGSSVFFATDFIDGETFHEFIIKGIGAAYEEMDVDSYLDRLEVILPSLYRKISEIHDCGVFHYDLSTSNVLLAPEGKVFLIDFEAGADNETRRRDTLTMGFSSPLHERGPLVDWFSFMRIAAFSLTGHSFTLDVFKDHLPTLKDYCFHLFGTRGVNLFEQFVEIEKIPSSFCELVTANHKNQLNGHFEAEENTGKTGRSWAKEEGLPANQFIGGIGAKLCARKLLLAGDSDSKVLLRDDSSSVRSHSWSGLSLREGLAGKIVAESVISPDLLGDTSKQFIDQLKLHLQQQSVDASLFDGLGGYLLALEIINRGIGQLGLSSLAKKLTQELDKACEESKLHEQMKPGLAHGYSGAACAVLASETVLPRDLRMKLAKRLLLCEESLLNYDDEMGPRVVVGGKSLPYLGVGCAGVLWARDSARAVGIGGLSETIDAGLLRHTRPGFYALPSLMKGASGIKLYVKRRRILGLSAPCPSEYDPEIWVSCSKSKEGALVSMADDALHTSSGFEGGVYGILWAEQIAPRSVLDFLPTPLFNGN